MNHSMEKTSWLIVLKEKCCWNDLILKGRKKETNGQKASAEAKRADAFYTSLFLMLHTADGHTATVQKWKCWNIPVKGLIQPYVMCVSVILCVPCQWKKNYVTFHLVKWLDSSTIFSREMKTFVNERNHRKMKEILQKGQSTHHPRIVIQQNTEVSDAPVEHHAVDPRVGHVTTCQ